jgi:prepilin-type N-terminal cleavage/methylation domain-containing protein
MAMTSTHRTNGRPRTGGFTLVELLVVFAIIAILSALSVAVVFKVIGVQQRGITEQTVKTVSSILDKHWAAVLSQNKNSAIPPKVMEIAGNDPRRARVIWNYLKLKQEFPMNLTEALAPFSLPASLVSAAPTSAQFALSASDLPTKPGYLAACQRASQISGSVFTPNSGTSPLVWPFESAFTLVMALQQERAGISFHEENFAVNALASDIFLWGGSPPQRSASPILSGPKMLVDAWEVPLVFIRWPVVYADFQPGTTNSPISATIRNANFPDPLDPEGTLLDPRWNNATNWSTFQGVWWFEKYCHSVHFMNGNTYTPVARYSEPVIISAGPDHQLGLQPAGTQLTLAGASVGPAPNLPNEMTVDSSNPNLELDNIASYKLRTGGRGDR